MITILTILCIPAIAAVTLSWRDNLRNCGRRTY